VRHWLAFYDIHANKLWGYTRHRKRAIEILEVLKLMRRRYPPKQRIHLILDNLSAKSQALVSREQHPSDLDADQRVLAEPDRMSVHTGQGVCHSKLKLPRPPRDQQSAETVRRLQKPSCQTKVVAPFWKRH